MLMYMFRPGISEQVVSDFVGHTCIVVKSWYHKDNRYDWQLQLQLLMIRVGEEAKYAKFPLMVAMLLVKSTFKL